MTLFTNTKIVGTVAVALVALFLSLMIAFTAVDRDALTDATAESNVQEASAEMPAVTSEVLWLARVIYSETKRPEEQELVAWVVRNRMETQYRGRSTYQQVVLDPWQFSAFNRNAPKRAHYSKLTVESQAAGWQTAIEIANAVANAPAQARPFGPETRHFYSEISMVGRSHPAWANGKRPVSLDRQIDPRRFRFFSHIA